MKRKALVLFAVVVALLASACQTNKPYDWYNLNKKYIHPFSGELEIKHVDFKGERIEKWWAEKPFKQKCFTRYFDFEKKVLLNGNIQRRLVLDKVVNGSNTRRYIPPAAILTWEVDQDGNLLTYDLEKPFDDHYQSYYIYEESEKDKTFWNHLVIKTCLNDPSSKIHIVKTGDIVYREDMKDFVQHLAYGLIDNHDDFRRFHRSPEMAIRVIGRSFYQDRQVLVCRGTGTAYLDKSPTDLAVRMERYCLIDLLTGIMLINEFTAQTELENGKVFEYISQAVTVQN